MRNTITRTFNTVFATVLVYKDGKVNPCELTLPDFCTLPVTAEKYIRKHTGMIDGNLITADSLKTVSELFGMEESDFIVAINKDKFAPIFSVSDIGIVGDACKIVPLLTERLRKELQK